MYTGFSYILTGRLYMQSWR